ncbi:MAG: NAD(P)(+) transhydrogenase (Re/Si-specific) subunit alpha, partial [Gammaproteobacteria bacterium]|nr:NAD(P)(+) transhydrogenase (Re/Si-specific) subunit alpha [Gammaproteobacteria bacterium]
MVAIAFPKETLDGEKRIAIVPSLVSKFKKLGAEVKIQQGAGESIFAADSSFKDADFLPTAKETFAAGDIVIKIQPPTKEEIGYMKEGAVLISTLYPHTHPELLKELNAKKITSFGLEM